MSGAEKFWISVFATLYFWSVYLIFFTEHYIISERRITHVDDSYWWVIVFVFFYVGSLFLVSLMILVFVINIKPAFYAFNEFLDKHL